MNQVKKIVLIMIVGLTFLISTNVNAQRGEDYTIVTSEELYNTLNEENNNSMRIGFCHDVNVTIDLSIMEIETTITICCGTEMFGCLPIVGNRENNSQIQYPNDLEITNSATVNQGQYIISIIPGRYHFNKKGEITNLRYKLNQI